MNEINFRILETLAREIGNSMSISILVKKIRDNYGSGDYKNIHKTIQNFTEKDIIKIEKTGNAIIVSLNFENYLLVDLLTEIELVKKIKFLEKHTEFQIIFSELNVYMKEFQEIKSLLLLNPERNAKLNRIELLFILKHDETQLEIKKMIRILDMLKDKHNTRMDYLLLEDNIFLDYLASPESNITKEVLKNKLILFRPQTFWIEIKEAIINGRNIKSRDIVKPTEVSEREHIYNLGRFGYTEFGNKIKGEDLIGIEFLITSILLKEKNSRHVEAIPIILAKNENEINYDLLVFLSMKYGTIEKLFGILKTVNVIKPMKKVAKAVKELARRKIIAVETNMAEMEEKLRLYNVIK